MIHTNDVALAERKKYEKIWDVEEYSNFSPGLQNVDRFMSVVMPPACSTVIDVGCGKAVAAAELSRRGLRAYAIDMVMPPMPPIDEPDAQYSILGPIALWHRDWLTKYRAGWDYAFCCDVLEHIPPEYSMLVVRNIIDCATHGAWIQLCNLPDAFGAAIGQPLHLTVRPFVWWRDRIFQLGEILDARDLCGNSLFYVRSRR